MIRSPRYVSVACRHPQEDGQPGSDTPIDIHTEAVRSAFLRWPRLKHVPLIRGMIALFEMLALGLRTLERSANIQADVLRALRPGIVPRVAAGGTLILSGLLAAHAESVAADISAAVFQRDGLVERIAVEVPRT